MTIGTKEIRNDLEGFLRRLKQGQIIQVLYRSRPMVILAAQKENYPYLKEDAGTPAAAKRSVHCVQSLPERKPSFDF